MHPRYRVYRFFTDDYGNLVRHVTLPGGRASFWYPAPSDPAYREPHAYFDEWGADRSRPAIVMATPPGGLRMR